MITPKTIDNNLDNAKGNPVDPFFDVPEDNATVIRRHSRSFSLAARCLPSGIRYDVEKLYAWCRWCDDSVDTAPNIQVANERLTSLRDDVERIFSGQAVRHPASQWLTDLVEKRGIEKQHALELLSGMEMDLHAWQVDDEADLILYCYRAAGVVGLMLCRIMGVRNRAAEKQAIQLGIAMQLTNIARDVAEDWQRGRCYLPKSWGDIDRNGQALPTNAQVAPSVARLLTLAETYYANGQMGINALPRSCRPAIVLASKLYREIGQQIRRKKHAVMDGRIVVPTGRIVVTVMRGMATGVLCTLSPTKKINFVSEATVLQPLPVPIGESTMNDARYLAYLSLSVASFGASIMFLLMLLNPKETSYATLPAIYAGISFLVAIVTYFLAKRAEAQPAAVKGPSR